MISRIIPAVIKYFLDFIFVSKLVYPVYQPLSKLQMNIIKQKELKKGHFESIFIGLSSSSAKIY